MSNYSDSSFSKDKNSSWYKVYSMIKPGSKVLDVGCSSGNFGEILRKKKCIVHGIEIDKDDFLEAQKKLDKVFSYNVETDKLNDLDHDYDYIYFGDVIEHLVRPEKSLARMQKFLKDDGRLLFSVPNMTHILVRLMLLQGKFEYGNTGLLDRTHLHYYDYDFLQRVLNEAGFEVVSIDPVQKDLPEEVIKEELARVGLKATKDFLAYTRASHAAYYQFVGQARKIPAGEKPKLKDLAVSSPVDAFQTYLDQTKNYYGNTIEALKADVQSQVHVREENERLKQELHAIKTSKGWKIIQRAHSIRNHIRKPFRRAHE
jgi:2-polyprenyl-3-methyl-5-hydroxy-6-metoxy-1,4-benzoquinol methylase